MRYYQKRMKLFFIISVLFIPLKVNAKENNSVLFSYSSPQHQVAQIGQQLYRALQQQQWKKAEELLLDYQQLPFHETLLIDYAKALLAQTKGNFLQAEFYYQQQLKQKADFIPAQTGLIQLYFHLREYKKAQQQLDQLSSIVDLPKDISQSIEFYKVKLAAYFQGQRFYQLSFFYNDNINHAPDIAEKVVSQSTQRKVTLRSAKPIVSTGLTHYFSFYQPVIIYSHHTFSSYTYARYIDYHSHRRANFLALYTQLGYRYQKSQYQWSMTPYYEIKNHKLNMNIKHGEMKRNFLILLIKSKLLI